jgi:enoyl-CoA hydratase
MVRGPASFRAGEGLSARITASPPEDPMPYENILVEARGRVALITLNRPKVLNALNDALMNDLGDALAKADADAGVGAIVLTRDERALAAGAAIDPIKKRT